MGSKKSSFHMGDEFNGKGEKVYLRATTCKTYEPLSQENVRLTPDFKAFVTKVLGAVPFMEAGGDLGSLAKAAGALAAVGQTIIKKDSETGKYQISFRVSKMRLTNGSYLHQSKKKKK